MQGAHAAYEGVGEPVAFYRERRPVWVGCASLGVGEGVGAAFGVVEVDAHVHTDRSVGSFPLDEAAGGFGWEIVAVVGDDEDALPLAIVEDDGGFGGGEGWGLRVADGFGVDALRRAEPGAD